jgi:hypothetical protein
MFKVKCAKQNTIEKKIIIINQIGRENIKANTKYINKMLEFNFLF